MRYVSASDELVGMVTGPVDVAMFCRAGSGSGAGDDGDGDGGEDGDGEGNEARDGARPEADDPFAEEDADREIEGWTDEDFFRVFPLYRDLEKKRNAAYLADWASCQSFQVRRTSRLMTRSFDWELRDAETEASLRSTQIPVLCLIRERQGKDSMRELAKRLFMHPSTLTRSVDVLERRGLVVRVMSARDRRVRSVRLTPDGEQALLLNIKGWRTARSHFSFQFRGTKRDEEQAFRGLTLIFGAARRCLYVRGLRWEMAAPP